MAILGILLDLFLCRFLFFATAVYRFENGDKLTFNCILLNGHDSYDSRRMRVKLR